MHDNAWNSLRGLNASDMRLALWYPYPRMGVAELTPSSPTTTSWDFSVMDPIVADFFSAAQGKPTVLSVATVPQWMFAGSQPALPGNPDEPVWNYEQGTILKDPTALQLADYYERVAAWYMRGGFRDELGAWHVSTHFYTPAYWEVGNEPEYEHALDAAVYTRIYDAVVARLHKSEPRLKFTGMSLAAPDKGEKFATYFLDPKNHAAGIPLDAISYHFYALGKQGDTAEQQAAGFFAQADHFLDTAARIDSIRARLSPHTETQINETGCIAAGDQGDGPGKMSGGDVSNEYLSLCGAMFAYLSARLAERGIQVVGASQLLGFPSQYPSVSLLDWNTGLPNVRYRSLELLIRCRTPGDRISTPLVNTTEVFAQAIRKRGGTRLLLLVNKTPADQTVRLSQRPRFAETVDSTTGSAQSRRKRIRSREIVLRGFAVTILTMR